MIKNKNINNNPSNESVGKEYSRIKIGFFKKIKISVIDFDKYHKIASERGIRGLLYLVELILVFAMILSFAISYKSTNAIKGIGKKLENQVPEFYVENNQMHIDSREPILIESQDYSEFKIILDNENEDLEYYKEQFEIKNNSEYIIVLNKDGVKIQTPTNQKIIKSYKELKEQYKISIESKRDIINLANNNELLLAIFVVMLIPLFITFFASTLLDVLALSLIGVIVKRLIRLPLNYSAIFGMSASAITLPIILNLIYLILNLIYGFEMEYFQVMYTIIAYIYLIAALIIMKANLVKNKIMIARIIENSGEDDISESEEQFKDENENKNEQ